MFDQEICFGLIIEFFTEFFISIRVNQHNWFDLQILYLIVVYECSSRNDLIRRTQKAFNNQFVDFFGLQSARSTNSESSIGKLLEQFLDFLTFGGMALVDDYPRVCLKKLSGCFPILCNRRQ
jgi:hypothetical protein